MTAIDESAAAAALAEAVRRQRNGSFTPEQAVSLLEKSAILVKSGGMPLEVTYEVMASLLEGLLQKKLASCAAQPEMRVIVLEEEPVESVKLARGLEVALTSMHELATVSLVPSQFEQGRRMMSFVGIGHDDSPDVSERHDDYLMDAYWSSDDSGEHGER